MLWSDNNLPWSDRRAEIHVEGLEFAPAAAISHRSKDTMQHGSTSDTQAQTGRFVQLQEDGSAALPGFSCAHKVVFFLTYLLYIAVNTVNGPLMPAMKVSLNFTSHEGATIAAVQTVSARLPPRQAPMLAPEASGTPSPRPHLGGHLSRQARLRGLAGGCVRRTAHVRGEHADRRRAGVHLLADDLVGRHRAHRLPR